MDAPHSVEQGAAEGTQYFTAFGVEDEGNARVGNGIASDGGDHLLALCVRLAQELSAGR
jgi:hypothetical protein